jgi:ATP-dependent Lhr-like helicase
LALDRDLLRELLGQEELRDLIDPAALADLELALQALVPERAARTVDALHDLLRRLGDLTTYEVAARITDAPSAREWLSTLEGSRRAVALRVAGEERWIAIEDAARYRDALGVALPVGIPTAFLSPPEAALDGLVARWARGHGPFHPPEPARRWAVPVARIEEALENLLKAGTILRGEFRPGGTEREWCDPEVLRQLRRRSLARLRKEVEPVEQIVLARFLPAWQGVRPVEVSSPAAESPPRGESGFRGIAALDRLVEVVDQLAGVPIPASVLERDVLPARIPGYQPRLLDELGALGEVTWSGRGSLGRDDGRVVLCRPGREALRDTAAADGERPGGELHERLRARLAGRGASFYREIAAAVGGATERDLLDALWDLVWAGEVTNDTFAPLRALRWRRPSGERRPRPGRAALGPPEAAGRWSLVERGAEADAAGMAAGNGISAGTFAGRGTQRLHSLAVGLLDRHGVLTREAVASEEVAGGFSAVYPVLRAMEESGRIRRGYFVDGLGAAQFALPGAVDRLRGMRLPPGATSADDVRPDLSGPPVYVLAATDPSNPYGAAIPWPRRDDSDRRPLPRAAGAYVVLVDGAAALYLERGGHSLQILPASDAGPVSAAAFAALRALVEDGRLRELVVTRVDGRPIAESPWRPSLEDAGFVAGYRGHVLRPLVRRAAQPAPRRSDAGPAADVRGPGGTRTR